MVHGVVRRALAASALVAASATAARAQGCPLGQVCEKGERRALVVGISSYAGLQPNKQLAYAHADARAIAAFLASSAGGGMKPANIRVLLQGAARSDSILYYVRDLWERVGPRDTVILYFAGHAAADDGIGGETYFLASNFEEKAFDNGSVRFDRLQQYAAAIQAKASAGRVVLILDACRSGAIGNATLTNLAQPSSREAWERVIRLVSSGQGELSQEDSTWGGGHGAFTYYLLKGLHGDSDPGNPAVLLEELGTFVRSAVRKATGGKQSPVAGGGTPSDTVHVLPPALATPGKGDEALARLLASLPKESAGRPMQVATRDVAVRRVPSGLDSAATEAMTAFVAAIEADRLDDSLPGNAPALYARLVALRGAAPVAGVARNLLVTALTGPGHRLIQRYLQGGDVQPPGETFRRAAALHARGAALLRADDPSRANFTARQRFLEGYAIVRDRDRLRHDEAARLLRESIALEPEVPYAYNALGLLLAQRGRADSAATLFRAASARAPKWQYPVVNTGLLRLERGDWAGAIAAFERAIAADSTTADAYNNLGNVYEALGRYAVAERWYRRAIAVNPAYAPARGNLAFLHRRRGRYDAAQAYLDTMATLERRDSLGAFPLWSTLEQGHLLEDRLDHAAALARFRQAAALAPGYAEPQRWLGETYRMMDSTAEARVAFARAIALDPRDAGAYVGLARLDMLAATPRWADAERTLRAARERAPHAAAPLAALGELYARQAADSSRPAAARARLAIRAESAYVAALRLDSLDVATHEALAALYVARGEAARAERQLQRAVAMNEGSVTARWALAEFQRERAAADPARRAAWARHREATLRALVTLDPELAAAHDALGLLYLERGALDSAATSLRQAAGLGFAAGALRERATTVRTRAGAFLAAGDLARAEAAYRLALELDPASALALEGLARAEYLLDRPADALAHAEAALPRAADAAQRGALVVLRAQILLDRDRAVEAAAALDSLVPDEDDFVDAHWLVAKAIANYAASAGRVDAATRESYRARALRAWAAAVAARTPDVESEAELRAHYSAWGRALVARVRSAAGR